MREERASVENCKKKKRSKERKSNLKQAPTPLLPHPSPRRLPCHSIPLSATPPHITPFCCLLLHLHLSSRHSIHCCTVRPSQMLVFPFFPSCLSLVCSSSHLLSTATSSALRVAEGAGSPTRGRLGVKAELQPGQVGTAVHAMFLSQRDTKSQTTV